MSARAFSLVKSCHTSSNELITNFNVSLSFQLIEILYFKRMFPFSDR